MKNITGCILIFILSSFVSLSFAQAPQNIKKLEEKYTEYFKLNRETVFLHLNKTTLVPKENLWISAYVYNSKLHLPNVETTNLNIDIFNGNGVFIDSKTVLVSGGKGSVHIELDPVIFTPGKYFLKASTNYMNNFEEDLSYLQSFTIYGDNEENPESKEKFDLQLLPEGGHIVEGVLNSIGVKLINNSGKGISFTKARVLNSSKQELTFFKSNKFGLAKFNLLPEGNEEYTVVLTTLSGEEISKMIPKAQQKGISLTSLERKDHFIFSLKTNQATRESLNNQKYFIAVHKDGAIKDFAFMFPENELEANITIEKDSLFSGVNTLTIFNENLEPVLERLIFNSNNIKHTRIAAKRTSQQGDSISIELKAARELKNNSLSISVLPAKTLSYNPDHSIVSAFYLKPYIQGNIDQASYYFSQGDEQRKLYDLDLLLLTQGWSKYNWNNIYSKTPTEKFLPERGFTVEGNIASRNAKKQTSLFVRSEKTGMFEIVKIQEDNSFKLNNIYLEDSTNIAVGLLNERNSEISKPRISINISPAKTRKNPLKITQLQLNTQPVNYYSNTEELDLIGNSVSLDTVSVSGINKNTGKYRNESNTFQEEVGITEAIASRYYYVTDLIASKGFRVIRTPTNVQIINNIPFSLNADPSALIIFNGAPLVNGAELLIDLQTSQVESIVINKRGEGYGMQGGNGVIKIVTKKGGALLPNSETMLSIIAQNGFTTDREFYTPRYTSYSSNAFEEYGSINWISNISLDSEGKAQFKILNTLQPEVKIVIEGMNAEGYLLSEELLVKTR